ncbi:hypothetical protein [Allosphingosinicella indica]|uniref:Uncharacterized protein n=1 Tax=Allosphingosinicella indica TaxID=941907 RepID=A0A1X7GJG0_9SPHN|nr:hypothetical protein [Allosphingosinicella indica]SMF70633.1 hypothetical protein SAMN06295910_1916 [Allosphingosinicella indica]
MPTWGDKWTVTLGLRTGLLIGGIIGGAFIVGAGFSTAVADDWFALAGAMLGAGITVVGSFAVADAVVDRKRRETKQIAVDAVDEALRIVRALFEGSRIEGEVITPDDFDRVILWVMELPVAAPPIDAAMRHAYYEIGRIPEGLVTSARTFVATRQLYPDDIGNRDAMSGLGQLLTIIARILSPTRNIPAWPRDD